MMFWSVMHCTVLAHHVISRSSFKLYWEKFPLCWCILCSDDPACFLTACVSQVHPGACGGWCLLSRNAAAVADAAASAVPMQAGWNPVTVSAKVKRKTMPCSLASLYFTALQVQVHFKSYAPGNKDDLSRLPPSLPPILKGKPSFPGLLWHNGSPF